MSTWSSYARTTTCTLMCSTVLECIRCYRVISPSMRAKIPTVSGVEAIACVQPHSICSLHRLLHTVKDLGHFLIRVKGRVRLRKLLLPLLLSTRHRPFSRLLLEQLVDPKSQVVLVPPSLQRWLSGISDRLATHRLTWWFRVLGVTVSVNSKYCSLDTEDGIIAAFFAGSYTVNTSRCGPKGQLARLRPTYPGPRRMTTSQQTSL
ncbi:uncharacterized protein BDW43DRAFT_239070 [Aspergillus alliaceus]|uniref:uncharacterized protein n=1 Tax=Petromyces alliaceus TaxID=209559 RepID=UPI0012A5F81A|nr:uncharacterized protein BDW43DRAFT_239070 [Aspergillus alliaceus]KAB8227670.1 hypothetical protein BDW43DRAFT_239070 [Aspergillus alliaceus]